MATFMRNMTYKIHMKKRKLLLLYLILQGVFPYANCQFYPVPEQVIDIRVLTKKDDQLSVKSFSISKLITVKEFNEYLLSVKEDSTSAFYQSQVPKSMQISEKLIQTILNSKELQDQPMPGVSWNVARNYCAWLSEKSKRQGLNFTYDLPLVSELIAFRQFYKTDTPNEFESWTLNAYDESILELSKIVDYQYQYDAQNSDPAAFKRKVIFGGSYHMDFFPNATNDYFQYEYQDSSSRYVGFKIVRKLNFTGNQNYNLKNSAVQFGTKNNRLNGLYVEKYKTGQSKVVGEFYDGQRIGIWSVFDTNGILKIQREYTGDKNCQFVYPISEHPYKKIYEMYPNYTLKRNMDQYYPYLYVEERAVQFSSRFWRQLTKENEAELFRAVDFQMMVTDLLKSNVKWYLYGSQGNFQTLIEGNDLVSLTSECATWDYSRIEIKEDFFFNKDMLLSDTRQLGINFYKNKEDKIPSYSLYYPYVRKELARIKMNINGLNEIKNLDDLFFFNGYRGKIVNSTSYNKIVKEKGDQVDWYLEVEKISLEHDNWIFFGR